MMSEQVFDQAFLDRLGAILSAVEQAGLEANDPHPLNAADYDVIYAAYAESGGDPASARKQIAVAKERRDQAFGRILQFISDLYGGGPIEDLGDVALSDTARDALDATEYWREDVEMHDAASQEESPLRVLLKTHDLLVEAMFDMHDAVLWPLARRISSRRRSA